MIKITIIIAYLEDDDGTRWTQCYSSEDELRDSLEDLEKGWGTGLVKMEHINLELPEHWPKD